MANYKFRQMLLPSSDHRTFGSMKPKTVVIHNTANRASAYNEASYVHSKKGGVSYHYAVDDKEAIQLMPHNKSGWHAGEGGRTIGGRNGIAIEICYSLDKGDKRYPIAEDNAAHLAAKILLQEGLTINDLSKHQDWSGKYCPHRMLDNKGWEPFKRKVAKYMGEIKGSSLSAESTGKGGMTMLGNRPVAIISIVNDGDISSGAMQQLLNYLTPDYNPVITKSGKFDYAGIKSNYIIALGGERKQHSGYCNYFISGRTAKDTLAKAKDFRSNKEKYRV